MRGDGGNHHKKLGLKRIWCVSQDSIPDTAGTVFDPACKTTDTRSTKPNQATTTPDFSYPLISFLSSSPISLSLPSSQNAKLIHPSLSFHAMIMC